MRREFSTASAFRRGGGRASCPFAGLARRRGGAGGRGLGRALRPRGGRGGGVDVGHRSCRNRAALRSAVEVFCPGYEGLAARGVREANFFAPRRSRIVFGDSNAELLKSIVPWAHKSAPQIFALAGLVSYRTLAHRDLITHFFPARGTSRLSRRYRDTPKPVGLPPEAADAAAPPPMAWRETGPKSPETRGPHRRPARARRHRPKDGLDQPKPVPDGMLIGPKNPIIEEALGDRDTNLKQRREDDAPQLSGRGWTVVQEPHRRSTALATRRQGREIARDEPY